MIENPIDTSGVGPGDYKLVMFQEMENVKNILDNVHYVLRANQYEAIFTHQVFMENDANPTMKNAILASSADGKFYNSNSEGADFWQQRAADGNYYRILENTKNSEWVISGETRKIGKYNCYKATKKVLLNNSMPIEVIAWFTPEVPFSFGPKGYGGLPGLIITLDERGFLFYVEKIKIHDKEIAVERPKQGKLVSPDEFDKLLQR